MNIFEFMGEHWFLTFLLAVLVYSIFWGIFITLPNRILRHWTIRKHGYPPSHCDADGDFEKEE